ncbi:anti-sigma factor RsbA family regulatory protein [Streptomyces albiaxialis]|uniref:Anti-sigma factor RsbA family regulatory protein n=1 Tax=Streptomyces albiaxialis TaxID=329523 RepID=A0ABP5HTE0_9ACTN
MTDPRVPPPPGAPSHAHHLMLYGSDTEFLEAAMPFARDGLALDEPVFVATTRHNSALIRRHLGPRANGIAFADDDWYHSPAQALLAYHDKARHTPGRSRVLGELPWDGLTHGQVREWTRYEALLTLALAATGAWHLCPYDTRALPSGLVRSAQLTHPTLTSGAKHRANPAHVAPEKFSAACDTAALDEPPDRCEEFAFAGPDELAAMRRFVARHARRAGLSSARGENLLICVDEAAANAIRHGGGAGHCRIWSTPAALFCEIADPEGTLSTALAGYLPPGTASLDGRGLWIIRQLSDAADMRTTKDGTLIRIRMARTVPTGPGVRGIKAGGRGR